MDRVAVGTNPTEDQLTRAQQIAPNGAPLAQRMLATQLPSGIPGRQFQRPVSLSILPVPPNALPAHASAQAVSSRQQGRTSHSNFVGAPHPGEGLKRIHADELKSAGANVGEKMRIARRWRGVRFLSGPAPKEV